MRLPEAAVGVVEWAYPGNRTVPCLCRVGSEWMLCGRRLNPGVQIGSVPVLQPVDPDPFCTNCVAELWALFGWCPVCGALAELVDGVIGGHGIAVRTREGVDVLPEQCAGKGMAAEGER